MFLRRLAIVLLVLLAAFSLWAIPNVLLVVFASLLCALAMDGLARTISDHTPLPRRVALSLVLLTIPGALGLVFYLAGPSIREQLETLADQLPQAVDRLEHTIRHWAWGDEALQSLPSLEKAAHNGDLVAPISGLLSSTLNTATNTLIVIIIGIYLAFDPDPYVEGAIRLVPPTHRDRAREVLERSGTALKRWLVGRFTSMVAVGVLTGIGLALLGLPLAPVLGLLAGLLSFIPNIGPILSAVPGLLIGFLDGPLFALQVGAVYAGAQALEGWLITPMVQRKTVSFQPAMLLFVQLLFGVLFGLFGLLLATPLAVAIIVLVQMLVIEDVYGDEPRIPGDG